jgi:hypothetical protein
MESRQTFVWVSYDIPTHDGRTTVESFETERAGAGFEESGPI